MWPSLFILGGGVSKNADKFVPRLTARTPVVPAQLRNDAGIIGAAIVAVDGLADAKTTWDDLPHGKRPASA
jgi:polyphosphate glucokinase